MGCITSADAKNPNKPKKIKENQKQIEPALYKSKLDKSTASKLITPRAQQLPSAQKTQTFASNKIKKTTSVQFLSLYQISSTLKESTRLEGAKLLTNKITGAVSVLRVLNGGRVNEERLRMYHKLLRFQLYTDEQENYLLVDQYCSGPTICQLSHPLQGQQLSSDEIRQRQQQIYETIIQVHGIITQFHSQKIHLGGLSLFSFKKVSEYDNRIRLVDYNLELQQARAHQHQMGHAHSNSLQSDWQFFGYLLQYYLTQQSPIFITHKMQYIDLHLPPPYSTMISTSLKGKPLSMDQLKQINPQQLIINNQNVLNGYRFCNDVLRLIKARRKRMKHKACYYSREIVEEYRLRSRKEGDDLEEEEMWRLNGVYDQRVEVVLTEDNLHRLQTDRILGEIQSYIQKLNSTCEQHFINYSAGGESFRKLKQVFLLSDKRQKLDEFRQLIPQIK